MDSYQIFVDLDGVLTDFGGAVRGLTGKDPAEIHPRRMWPILAKTPRFYDKLSWTADGRKLWNAVKRHSPVILTGLPRGNWAEPQKRSWCARELGEKVPVITGLSRLKAELARNWLTEQGLADRDPILIDDRLELRDSWESAGGTFIFHLDTERSIQELKDLGFEL